MEPNTSKYIWRIGEGVENTKGQSAKVTSIGVAKM